MGEFTTEPHAAGWKINFYITHTGNSLQRLSHMPDA